MRKDDSVVTDITTDREARLAWVLEDATYLCSSLGEKLRSAGAIAAGGQRTAQELTWRLLLAQTLQQTDLLRSAIALLAEAREDVGEVRS